MLEDEDFVRLASSLVDARYISVAQQGERAHSRRIHSLLAHRQLPDEGWSETAIESFLYSLSALDSNNFSDNIGIGEREGRVFSSIVRRRHFGLAHGIGRSGDLQADQPKAAGSSLLLKLCTCLVQHALCVAGASKEAVRGCVLVPCATGMTLTLTLLALRQLRPEAEFVIWPRIDQKSCYKSMLAAGLKPIVMENILEGDELRTSMEDVQEAIDRIGSERILCILSTTSCFAPRTPDRIDEIARLCFRYDIPHLCNNAYGVQSQSIMKLINRAICVGRLDAIVQSMDKNFMVPVGGSILCGPNEEFLHSVSALYPGRASASPIVDLLVTLLSMGKDGWMQLLRVREENFSLLRDRLSDFASEIGERMLETPHNPISLGMTLSCSLFGHNDDEVHLDNFPSSTTDAPLSVSSDTASTSSSLVNTATVIRSIGSSLYYRAVSGARVIVSDGKETKIAGHSFSSFGANCDSYPFPYMTAAGALGLEKDEIDDFIIRLRKIITKEAKLQRKKSLIAAYMDLQALDGMNASKEALASDNSSVE